MPSTNCPGVAELSAYLVGNLPDPRAELVAHHVDTCADCQAAIQTLDQPDDKLVWNIRQSLAAPPFVVEDECRRAVARIQAIIPAPAARGAPYPAWQAAPSRPLTHLGGYELVAKLGEGGMGTVYKARQPHLDRWVAIKVLPADRLRDVRAVARFQREIKTVGKLQHPNIVVAHDAGEEEGMHYLVMEYVDGCDLSVISRRCGPLAVADACEIVRQAAVALQHAHEHGLVHRDVKPSNLMLTTTGQVKLLDLGLALEAQLQPADDELTATNQMMGTADYMAPEQAGDSHSVDIRADIYSLGCTLYKLLAGEAPFSGPKYRTSLEKMMAHTNRPVPPISQRRNDLPAALVLALAGMLAKKPADRYGTPAQAAARLSPFAGGCDLAGLAARCIHESHADAASPQPSSNTGKLLSNALTGTRPSDSVPNATLGVSTGSASVGNAVSGVPAAGVGQRVARARNGPLVETLPSRAFSVGGETYRRLAPVVGALWRHAFAFGRAIAARMVARTAELTPQVRRRVKVATGAAAVMLLAGIVLYIETGKGTVRFEINDPAIEVRIDGTNATITGAIANPVELRAGEHGLRVKYRELEFETDKFTLKRGDTMTLKIELLPGKVQAAEGDVVLGERPLAAIAPFDAEQARGLQEAWAKHLGIEVETTNSLGMKLRLIPPGEFMMGTDDAEIRTLRRTTSHDFTNESPKHRVRLTNPYFLGMHEVTRQQYFEVMGVGPVQGDAGKQPVNAVSWFDAVEFCNELSEHEGLPPYYLLEGQNVTQQGGGGYRLPTEAEWEYACRAGTITRWSFGDDEQEYAEHAAGPAARRPPNPFGLFDMHGNVSEWCWDWYAAFAGREITDPTGPADGKERVLRSLSSSLQPVFDRCASRKKTSPQDLVHSGMRVARTIDAKTVSTNQAPKVSINSRVNVPLVGTNTFQEPVELTAEGKSQEVGQRVGGIPSDFPSQAVTRLVDWDSDGKLDLLVGAGDGYVWQFMNIGSRTEFRLAPGERVHDGEVELRAGTKLTTACFVDMSGDRKADLVVAHSNDQLRLFVNQGTAAVPKFNGFISLRGSNGNEFRLPGCGARIDVADWNGDSLPDILAGSGGGTFVLFQNTGAPESPRFETAAVPLVYQGAAFKNPYNVHPTVFDLNQDGRPDVAYGINWGLVEFFISDLLSESNSTFAFRHLISAVTPAGKDFNIREIAGDNTTPTFGDVNGDGTLDMVSGGAKGKLWLMLGVPNSGWDPSAGGSKPAGE